MPSDLQFSKDLFSNYENFKEKSLTHRRFKHSDIKPLIERLKNTDIFQVDKAGVSSEGRDIFLIKAGTGKTKLFLWSQMHGDEPTATAALFDIFNFFLVDNLFPEIKNQFLSKLTIYFLPMVNPDGAEQFQRRNIFEIDINRDAVSQQTKEGILLRSIFEKLKANFGFNLHDQGRNYSAGYNRKSAGISFLAPSPDIARSITPVRKDAMKLISQLYTILNEFIPGHIAKYSDEYEPRAFGDNFTAWGTSTILLESGGWQDDREKQFLRRLNCISLLTAFKIISEESYKNQDIKVYDSIPENKELMMDLILRNLILKNGPTEMRLDIGINYEEKNINYAGSFYLKAMIEDMGDLSVYSGYEEIDLKGHTVEPGKIFAKIFHAEADLKSINLDELFRSGYTDVILKTDSLQEDFSPYQFNIRIQEASTFTNNIKVEAIPNLVIRKDDQVCFVVVNGFVIDVNQPEKYSGNALILRED